MALSKVLYNKGKESFEFEVHLSEIAGLVKSGAKLSSHSVLVVLLPVLSKALTKFQDYSTEKDLKIQFSINTRTLAITLVAVTAVGVITYTYGIIPAIGATALFTGIYFVAKGLRPQSFFSNDYGVVPKDFLALHFPETL